MFLKFNQIFPTVIDDSEIPNDLLRELKNPQLQKQKMYLNEETHVEVYLSLIPLVEEISRIRMRDIVYKHRQLFHYDCTKVKGYLLHALYGIIKDIHLEVDEWQHRIRYGTMLPRVKRALFYKLLFSINEMRDHNEYDEHIHDNRLWNIFQNQAPFDKEDFKKEILLYYDILLDSNLNLNFPVKSIVNISLNFYRSSYLARYGVYDPAYPPDRTWRNYQQLKNAPRFFPRRGGDNINDYRDAAQAVEDEEWYWLSD